MEVCGGGGFNNNKNNSQTTTPTTDPMVSTPVSAGTAAVLRAGSTAVRGDTFSSPPTNVFGPRDARIWGGCMDYNQPTVGSSARARLRSLTLRSAGMDSKYIINGPPHRGTGLRSV